MSVTTLLKRLQRDGVTLAANGDKLKIKAPAELDAQVLAEVKAAKAELLQVLAAPKVTSQTEPASTCSTPEPAETPDKWWLLDKYRLPPINERCATAARVVVADPTPAQVLAMTNETRNEAAALVEALRAQGVRVFTSCRAGRLSFAYPRLCVEYDRIARDDWHALYRLRAEIHDLCTGEFER